ncbi:MAG: zinc-binding dehydrogenase, partial [Thermoprotei archaeon]
HALKVKGGLVEGEKVLVTGAGGGVGIHAVQMAKALGAKVIAVTTSEWKIDKIRSAGADDIIISKGTFSDDVKKLTDGEGVDLVLESVGQPTFEQSFRSVRWGGRIIVVGNVNVQPVNLNLGPLILRGVTISGSVSSTKIDLLQALRLTAEGKIKPIIHDVVPLEQVQQVHDMMRKKETVGRVLLRTE